MSREFLLFVLTYCALAVASNDFRVDIGATGDYAIYVKGKPWLYSAPTTFRFDGKDYSSADGSLKLDQTVTDSGEDRVGPWKSYGFLYTAGANKVIASFRSYEGRTMVVFGQEFISGGNNCTTHKPDEVISRFPSFRVDGSVADLGYLAYGYLMVADMEKKLGRWDNRTFTMKSGRNSGPLALFDAHDNAMFMTPFSEFMSGSAVYDEAGKVYSSGIVGTVKDVPEGFSFQTILYYSDKGINKAIEGWGEVMRTYYDKKPDYREADFTNNYLSYWSDNGAYYVNYYSHDSLIDNMTYEQAILAVKDYADAMDIPYRSVQYSVWFEQGKGGGIKAWNASDILFKDGMQYMYEKTKWVSTAHNRWWTVDTPYAKQNGGPYDWIIEKGNKESLPIDQQFWTDMFRWSRQWGFYCYMQDWLNTQFDALEATTTTVDVARTWLMQMGAGAQENGITVQYCMSESRHVLQSLEIPVVTQARASNDYSPDTTQWKIGMSSMFAWAVGMAPFKDVFWTTTDQPHNFYNRTEPYPWLQIVVATLSTGPVGPGDMVGHTNRDLLMRCCAADGFILKPSRPAMAIDKQVKQLAFGGNLGPIGELWSTHSDIGQYRFGIIFAARLQNWFTLSPSDTSFGEMLPSSKVFESDGVSASTPTDFSSAHLLGLTQRCSLTNLCLFYATPVLSFMNKELLLLGELSKVVPMSPQRVVDIQYDEADFRVKLRGKSGEKVMFSYMWGGQVTGVECVMALAGTARISVANGRCYSV